MILTSLPPLYDKLALSLCLKFLYRAAWDSWDMDLPHVLGYQSDEPCSYDGVMANHTPRLLIATD